MFFLAFSYFVIPEFRVDLLKAVKDENEKDSIEYEVEMSLFKWKELFYNKI